MPLLPLANLGGLIDLVIVIVSLVFLFTKPLRRAVWDLAAKTIVVDKQGHATNVSTIAATNAAPASSRR